MKIIIPILTSLIPMFTATGSVFYADLTNIAYNGTATGDIVYEGSPDSLVEGNDGGVNWGGLGNGFFDLTFSLSDISGPEIFVYEAQSGLPELDFRVLVADNTSAFSNEDFDDITSSLSSSYQTVNDAAFDSNYIYSFDISSVGYEVQRIRILGTALSAPGGTISEGNGFELDAIALVNDASSVVPEPSYFVLCIGVGAFVALSRKRKG
ncbi:hypothetical protein [Lentimonas sp. CC4]|nr:hypothetical protein [Lentimonas sp. CC4]